LPCAGSEPGRSGRFLDGPEITSLSWAAFSLLFPVVTELSAIRRLLVIAPLTALCACATTDPARSEVTELRAELRALRETNARLENRLDRLEGQAAVLSARGASAPASSAPASPPPAAAPARTEKLEMPRLAVVKLMPKEEKDEGEAVLFTNEGSAPKLDTSTPVQEPSPEVLDELAQVRKVAAPAREGGSATGSATPEELSVLDRAYEAGLEALRTGNVAGGVDKLQRFALENPRHPKADNALYFSGIGQMGLDAHAQAARTFEQLLSTYPAGDAVVDTLLKLAECRVRLNQKKDAKALYVQLISQYPGTAAASLAETRLGTLTH
jgi:tol-pal system protein YbgF